MKLNKTLLSIGTLAAVVTPIATVVSCGDKTPAKELPPVGNHDGHEGDQGPTNQAPKNTGPAVSDDKVLASGILNYMPTGTYTNKQLNDIFNQFSTKMNFKGPAFSMTNIGAATIDDTKAILKVMIVTKPIQNHGAVVFLTGNLRVGTNGHIYFTYCDFNEAVNIKDEPAFGETNFHQLDITDPNVVNKDIGFAFMPDLDHEEVMAKLQKLADDKDINK